MGFFGSRMCVALALALALCLGPSGAVADRATARALTAEGQNFAERGQIELALERYQRAIRSDPDYHASYQLALPLWMRLHKHKRAQASLEALTLRCRDCVFAWYALGALYRKRGRFDLAVLAYETYLSKRPNDPDAHFGLAMALGVRKDEKAVSVLRRYLRLENRPEREAYRQQAQRQLAELVGADHLAASASQPQPELHRGATGGLVSIVALVDEGHLLSATRLLNQRHEVSPGALAIRARIAGARGQWFQRCGFLALVWLWR